jgi:hypothetical protein
LEEPVASIPDTIPGRFWQQVSSVAHGIMIQTTIKNFTIVMIPNTINGRCYAGSTARKC